jgi:hypothetical protein
MHRLAVEASVLFRRLFLRQALRTAVKHAPCDQDQQQQPKVSLSCFVWAIPPE